MSARKWHQYSHDEKIVKFGKPCQFCGKPYVDMVAKWSHEQKCVSRDQGANLRGIPQVKPSPSLP